MTPRLFARAAGFALAGSGLLLFASPVFAAPTPTGSYQQTCRNISTMSTTLYAECKTRAGEWDDAQLKDYRSCRGDIANINGVLVCGELRGSGNNRADADEAESGNERRRDHSDRDRAGYNDRDQDDDNDADTNRNDEERTVDLRPGGSYRVTCRNVHIDGDDLIAECRTWDGEWHRSRLDDFAKCGGGIVNNDGRLRCGQGRDNRQQGNWQPRGSYQDSCRNIRFERGTLQAECRARSGWKYSELDNARGCRGDIANERGRLVCATGNDDRWGRITLFTDSRYRGDRRVYDRDTPDLGPFADRVSSASISGGTWKLCTRRSYGGRCVTISDSVRDFVDIGLNDRVESIRRVR